MTQGGYAIIPVVDHTSALAIQDGYWLSGALTVVAAALVTIVILISSRSKGPR